MRRLLALVGAGYYAFFIKKDGGGTPGPGTQTGRKITVSKAGGENTFGTLREALLKAVAGDTIVIAEARLVEPALKLDRGRHKDVTVESGLPDGRPAVIEFLGTKGGAMLDVPSVENFRLRNVELDGKGQAEKGVAVSGLAAGTTFEGVTVRNVTIAGFYLQNLAGDAARPVTLDRVRVVLTPTNEGGVVSHAYGDLSNKFIAIKNSRFEGPGKSGVRFDGPVQEADVTNNRFYNLGTGSAVSFARPGGKASKGSFTNNTVYKAQAGLLFEAPVAEGPYEFKVALNYFAWTPAALQAQAAVPGLVVENNLLAVNSAPGNQPQPIEKRDEPTLPEPNPEADATFLRFPANTGPTAGPAKARVGAQ